MAIGGQAGAEGPVLDAPVQGLDLAQQGQQRGRLTLQVGGDRIHIGEQGLEPGLPGAGFRVVVGTGVAHGAWGWRSRLQVVESRAMVRGIRD